MKHLVQTILSRVTYFSRFKDKSHILYFTSAVQILRFSKKKNNLKTRVLVEHLKTRVLVKVEEMLASNQKFP